MQCNYGWDWGPMCVTCGIWKNIELQAFSNSKLEDVLITQDHATTGEVALKLDVQLKNTASSPLQIAITVQYQGDTLQSLFLERTNNTFAASCVIKEPKLW